MRSNGEASPAPAPRLRLRWKLAALATFLAVVPLMAVGVALIRVNAAAVEQLSRELQVLVLEDVARTIDESLDGAEAALATAAALFADPELDDASRLALIRALVSGDEALDHVALYAADGERLAIIEEEDRAGAPLPDMLEPALRERAAAEGAVNGEIVLQRGEPRLSMVVPIRVEDRTTGYVASFVGLERVQRRIERIAEGHFAGLPDPLFVVDRELRIIAHSDRERAMAFSSAADDPLFRGLDVGLLGPSFSQAGEHVARDGTPMLGSTTGLARVPWAIVTQVPQRVAYASLHRMTIIVLATIGGAIALALLLGLLTARRLSRPIDRLVAFAKALAERRFDERVAVRTRDELEVLAHTMNTAAADLAASEDRIRREIAIRSDLGRYLPGELVDQIVRRERDMALGGKRQPVTVMFADVVGFTPLTEQLAPEHVVTILNELFTILTGIVFRHGGTVDKFVGDCVMAIWNAPSAQPDHVRRAVEAAEDMLSWLETGNARWEQTYGVSIQLAIGIHTGEAIVGNVGSETRMEYTAIGDAVNLAARLEAIARPAQILVTDAVRRAVSEDFDFVDADLHRLSGRSEPVHLWEVRW